MFSYDFHVVPILQGLLLFLCVLGFFVVKRKKIKCECFFQMEACLVPIHVVLRRSFGGWARQVNKLSKFMSVLLLLWLVRWLD